MQGLYVRSSTNTELVPTQAFSRSVRPGLRPVGHQTSQGVITEHLVFSISQTLERCAERCGERNRCGRDDRRACRRECYGDVTTEPLSLQGLRSQPSWLIWRGDAVYIVLGRPLREFSSTRWTNHFDIAAGGLGALCLLLLRFRIFSSISITPSAIILLLE